MKDLNPIKGKYYIEELVAEGEHDRQDFKFLISDSRKIARSISAFANYKGGHLLIGVKDNGVIAGVRNEEDIYVVEQAARQYCNPPQQVEFSAFKVSSGVTVIRAVIAQAQSRPVFAMDIDRKWKAYYRIGDENIVAHPLMVKAWQRRESMSADALMFSLTEVESGLLRILDNANRILTPKDIALSLHLPIALTGNLIVKLASIGVIDFKYTGNGEFGIVRTDS